MNPYRISRWLITYLFQGTWVKSSKLCRYCSGNQIFGELTCSTIMSGLTVFQNAHFHLSVLLLKCYMSLKGWCFIKRWAFNSCSISTSYESSLLPLEQQRATSLNKTESNSLESLMGKTWPFRTTEWACIMSLSSSPTQSFIFEN